MLIFFYRNLLVAFHYDLLGASIYDNEETTQIGNNKGDALAETHVYLCLRNAFLSIWSTVKTQFLQLDIPNQKLRNLVNLLSCGELDELI